MSASPGRPRLRTSRWYRKTLSLLLSAGLAANQATITTVVVATTRVVIAKLLSPTPGGKERKRRAERASLAPQIGKARAAAK